MLATVLGTFFASDNAWAQELESNIERANKGTLKAGGSSNNISTHDIFDGPNAGFGARVKKNQRQLFDDIRGHEAAALARWAPALRPNDHRELAFQQSCSCRFSNVLFYGMPSLHSCFTNNELYSLDS